ncbi:hypothetical protein ACFLW5_01035 [Chloroflexota bacterium]
MVNKLRGVTNITMWKLKGCPRCGGDLLIEKDLFYGWNEKCFQCSFSRDIKELGKIEKASGLTEKSQITS